MTMAYIRKHYSVPAKRGARVRYTSGGDEVMEGRIVGSVGNYLRVRFDGKRRSLRCHPTWQMEYLESPVTQESQP